MGNRDLILIEMGNDVLSGIATGKLVYPYE